MFGNRYWQIKPLQNETNCGPRLLKFERLYWLFAIKWTSGANLAQLIQHGLKLCRYCKLTTQNEKDAMPRPRVDWVSTDWHLFHDNAISWADRPANHTELIIQKHRQLILSQDTLINLGDVIFRQLNRLPEILSLIAGKKVLVLGNHDKESRGWYERNGFDFVCDSFTLGTTLFTHQPVEVLPAGITLNIHGHWHHTDQVHNEAPWWSPTTHHKLALEETGYAPVNLRQLLDRRRSS